MLAIRVQSEIAERLSLFRATTANEVLLNLLLNRKPVELPKVNKVRWNLDFPGSFQFFFDVFLFPEENGWMVRYFLHLLEGVLWFFYLKPGKSQKPRLCEEQPVIDRGPQGMMLY